MPLLTPPRFSALRAALAGPHEAQPTVPAAAGNLAATDRYLTRAIATASSRHMRRTGTADHARRVGRLAGLTAMQLGQPAAQAGRIRMAALVHDVGKAWIPESVLMKPGALSADEWLLIEAHPITGAGMLAGSELSDIASWVLAHHERPDGRGYPHGRLGSDTPIEARILAVCDAFDAMTSARPNSPARALADALDELSANSGTQFDAQVVAAFHQAIRDCDPVHHAA